jgi:hypothetical protein
MRKLFVAVLALSVGCSARTFDPKTYISSSFTPIPGVPDARWSSCYNSALNDTGNRSHGPSAAANVAKWKPATRKCAELEYMKECLASAQETDEAALASFKTNVPQWGDTWEDMLDEAIHEQCNEQGGATSEERALLRILRPKARDAGKKACGC